MSRIIGYHYDKWEFDETAMEKILVAAKAAGVVTEFDTGRGGVVWFNGKPGPELRAVRDAVLKLLPPGATSTPYVAV